MVESKAENQAAQILVVEDETEIRELISLLLLRQGHRVQQSATAMEALDLLKKQKYDLIILDWMLPQMSGLEFLKEIQDHSQRPPVLMVTAKAEPNDIILGLETGADDYITKPFEPAIFTARAKALLRRTKKENEISAEKNIVGFGQLTMNLVTYEVKNLGEQLHLTPSEFKIVAEMAKNKGKVLTRDYLVKVVQGEGVTVTGRTIDTHVFGLRKKLGSTSDWIETIRGVGYRVRIE